MFKFEDPSYLWLLCLVPCLVVLRYYGLWRRHRKLRKIGDKELLKSLSCQTPHRLDWHVSSGF